MDTATAFVNFGIALGVGLLVGLQRERAASAVAGIRTFALIALLGAGAAAIAQSMGAWIVGAGFLGVAVLAYVGNMTRAQGDESPGVTTEAAMLVIYAVGAMIVTGPTAPAVAVGVATAVLLQLKPTLQKFARRLSEEDLRAIMQFAAMTLIILPLVPDREYGPYMVLNPHHIWLMVVLVVGISLLAYVAYQLLGSRHGTVVSGVLGGLISSTATSVSFARRVRESGSAAGVATLAIMLANTVLLGRVLIEIYAVASSHFLRLAAPIFVLIGVQVVLVGICFVLAKDRSEEIPPPKNPSELKPALVFALIYAVVTVAAAAGNDLFGRTGALIVAAISGLTDMDAITLTNARMVSNQTMEAGLASTAIVVAILSNSIFKAVTVCVIGGKAITRRIVPLAVAQAGGCVVAIVLERMGVFG